MNTPEIILLVLVGAIALLLIVLMFKMPKGKGSSDITTSGIAAIGAAAFGASAVSGAIIGSDATSAKEGRPVDCDRGSDS
ncbi:MAG: hypothetical protein IPP57_13835 [Candidatus Obscuribacter sp.]|jgi:hypothetical protein|nr:hypothetical protein [Candidatus Obscuribacter sp.]MBK9201075.1 hypothetical protein [Candidatus Obscuribacter sp.]MBK9621740.1 hypothetical protein [Candidatus Obscuribacter sp.]MBK9771875.1 hypothetical protein [Candidatus Obscuribacter sp.]